MSYGESTEFHSSPVFCKNTTTYQFVVFYFFIQHLYYFIIYFQNLNLSPFFYSFSLISPNDLFMRGTITVSLVRGSVPKLRWSLLKLFKLFSFLDEFHPVSFSNRNTYRLNISCWNNWHACNNDKSRLYKPNVFPKPVISSRRDRENYPHRSWNLAWDIFSRSSGEHSG